MSATVRCPKCDHDHGADLSRWDYATYFDVECEGCGIAFDVEVEAIPEFHAVVRRPAGGSR
jgi:hypothetical protein